MWQEFKKFALRGNMLDLAVGIIIGSAFTKIITSLVDDILMPVIGLLIGRINFANLFFALSKQKFPTIEAAKAAGVATINYGLFINNIIDFFITAFAIFFIIRYINRLHHVGHKKEATTAPENKLCPFCTSTIPIKAKKCPQCTADLNTETVNQERS